MKSRWWALGVLLALGGCSLFVGGEAAVDVEGSFSGSFGEEDCAGRTGNGTFGLELDQVRSDLQGFWYMDGVLGGLVSGRVAGDRIVELTFEGLEGQFFGTGQATILEAGDRIAGRVSGSDPTGRCPTQVAFDVQRPPAVAAAAGGPRAR